jgi:hypothetical protein
MNDLAKQESNVVAIPQAGSLLEAISRAASDPAMDMDKVERLFTMHQALQKQQAETAFNAAMARAQSRMEPVIKNKRNEQTSSNYANLAAINEAIKPVYTEEGFSITFDQGESPKPDYLRLNAYVMHEFGHTKQLHLDMPPDESGIKGTVNKTKVHATGSTNMYARRYLTCMAFNIDTVDDTDGNKKKSMYAENVPPERRSEVQKIASEMLGFLRDNLVSDAVECGQKAGFSTEEKAFLWTFFNSGQRSAMMRVSDAKRKASKITDGQKKRLEARIGEFNLDRENVKKYCEDQYGVKHFAELTVADYEDLDLTLESMAKAE